VAAWWAGTFLLEVGMRIHLEKQRSAVSVQRSGNGERRAKGGRQSTELRAQRRPKMPN
jgi:hypothetical protein